MYNSNHFVRPPENSAYTPLYFKVPVQHASSTLIVISHPSGERGKLPTYVTYTIVLIQAENIANIPVYAL